MTEEKKEESKVYFGCIPKEEVLKTIEAFKTALAEGKKEDEVKRAAFSIRGTPNDPKGFASETYSYDEKEFEKYFDMSQEHLKSALTCITVQLNAKDEKQVEVIKELYDKFLMPMITENPMYKKKKDDISINFRSKGTKINIDVCNNNGKYLKPLMDLGLNLSQYGKFKVGFKTEFCPPDFLNLSLVELAGKLLQFVLSCEGEGKNCKFLLTAALKALNGIKLTKEKYQKKLNKLIKYVVLLNAFVKAETVIEFDPKEICASIMQVGTEALESDPNAQLEGVKSMALGAGAQFIKPTLESMNLLEPAKAVNIDELIIAFAVPANKAGIAHCLKLPGITQLINEKFLA